MMLVKFYFGLLVNMTEKYVDSNFREFVFDGAHGYTHDLVFDKMNLDDEGPRKAVQSIQKNMRYNIRKYFL